MKELAGWIISLLLATTSVVVYAADSPGRMGEGGMMGSGMAGDGSMMGTGFMIACMVVGVLLLTLLVLGVFALVKYLRRK